MITWARRKACRALDLGLLPVVPKRRKLAALYWIETLRGTCESELRYLDRIVQSRDVAVDVGANVGLYSYRMAALFSQVYAFEINDELTQYLEAFNPGNIEVIHAGLSSSAKESVFYIPVSNGVQLTGWGSLDPANCPKATDVIEKRVQLCRLDDFQIKSVTFIKIDVEGHEVEVLKGAQETMRRCRPTVLIEIKNDNRSEVMDFFKRLGYEHHTLRELVGVDGSEWNHIFVPNADRAVGDSLQARCRSN